MDGVVVFDADSRFLSEFKDGPVLFVGVRRQGGSNVYSMRSLTEDLTSSCDGLMERALNWRSVRVIVCARVLDPVFAKSEEPQFGGLSTSQLCYFLERLKLMRNFAGIEFRGFDEESQLKSFFIGLIGAK